MPHGIFFLPFMRERAAHLEKICGYVFYLQGWDYNLIDRNHVPSVRAVAAWNKRDRNSSTNSLEHLALF